ncbi:MAG: hypothetical protein Q9163_003724 [Psora crenata]
MKSTIVPVLDDETIKHELEQVRRNHPNYIFDTSIALDGSFGDSSEGEYIFDLGSDSSDLPADSPLPEVEAMRVACASGDLIPVQSVFKTYWLDRPVSERIDKGLFGASGLCDAIKRDDAVIGSYLLSHVLSFNERHFAIATEYRSYSILQLFVGLGWDINTSLGRRQPPALSLAIEDKELTLWFLSHGADPNAVCGLDITPLSIAVRDSPFDIIRILFDKGGTIKHGQLLHFAAKRVLPDRVKVFEYLLEKGASINGIMFQDYPESYEQERYSGLGTPLHSAAKAGHLDIVEMMLLKGADPLIKDSTGRLAIELAEYYSFSAVTALLRPLSVLPARLRDQETESGHLGKK